MASEFTQTFLKDVDLLLVSMREDSGTDTIELARALHSLKSGSSFLGWENLESYAHAFEDLLKEGKVGDVDWNTAADGIEDLLAPHRIEAVSLKGKGREEQEAIEFSELEKRVLEDSRLRGERFYRLTCSVDPSEPLPYPRAYLISSRLETGMTLVKSNPSMVNREANFSRPVFWFTTDVPESEIYKVAEVDLVKVLELSRIEYADALATGKVSIGTGSRTPTEDDPTLVVDRSRFTEVNEIAEELTWRLEKNPGSREANLAAELLRSLEGLAYRPLEPMLTEISEAVVRLSARRGLECRFEWNVASGGLDASTLETLVEILRQLVRNSLRHGIEAPGDRQLMGKDRLGTITFSMERSGKAYRFVFEDDGRGIDEDSVRERAKIDGLIGHKDSERNLLDILCAPGFTTADEADRDGGRGLGLEMIRHLLVREFESELELENHPGRGLSISWNLPEKHMQRPYLVFVSDGQSWAIPADSVRRRGVMDTGKISASGQAYDIGGGLIPIVGPEGLRPPGTNMPYILEINHRGRRAALFVEDLLSEEPWGADQLLPSDPATRWCRSLKSAEEGIPILSPAIVYARDSLSG